MPADVLSPTSIEELQSALAEAGSRGRTVELGGGFSKRAWGGPTPADGARISTRALDKLLAYEPNDLTLGVEAGMGWADLERLLAENGQMAPINPPDPASATVGGVVATAWAGPRRRRFGGVRDQVIGMSFVTIDGKLARSGGMVVKNVTGLDMAKLMIGSWGSLAAIASVNFKVQPRPARSTTVVFLSDSVRDLIALRRLLLSGAAQPWALDLVNAATARFLGLDAPRDYLMLAEAGGSEAVSERFARDVEAAARSLGVEAIRLDAAGAATTWIAIRDFPLRAAAARPEDSAELRLAVEPARLLAALECAAVDSSTMILARAADAVLVAVGDAGEAAARLLADWREEGFSPLLARASAAERGKVEMWRPRAPEFEIMRRVKAELDPKNLLNPGRVQGRL